MNIIFGSSGHAKEISYFLANLNRGQECISYFVSNDARASLLRGIQVIPEEEFIRILNNVSQIFNAYVAIGDGIIRKKIVEKFLSFNKLIYPNLISDFVITELSNINIADGNVFFPSAMLTTEIRIGMHNHFNIGVSISHECTIGNYNTFSPGVRIAGNVTIGNGNYFGIGSCVIDKVRIADDIYIGAGAVVTKNISEPGVYAGVPAKKIK